MMPMRSDENHQLRWLDVLDDRFEWLNVADWEPRDGGLQPVRVPRFWRDQWPSRTASWQIGGRRGTAETAAQYAAKYDAYLTTVRAAAPTKPILCITPILNRADLKPVAIKMARDPIFIATALPVSYAGGNNQI